VLGDAATPEILDSWTAAHGQLAGIMIGREQALYDEGAAQSGGWRGFKPFRVARRVQESALTVSFHLVPADGTPLPDFKPGQYVSVKTCTPGFQYEQIRQYSLSDVADGRRYRISVRREGTADTPAGQVSSFLHDFLPEDGELLVHMPGGDFVLDEGSDSPVVLISGGAGITAVLAMLEHLAVHSTREVLMLHGARSREHHAFAARLRELAAQRSGIRSVTLYETASPSDVVGEHHDAVGRITAEVIRAHLPDGEAEFYYCGPIGFMTATEQALDMLDIPLARRHSEAFAPDPSFAA